MKIPAVKETGVKISSSVNVVESLVEDFRSEKRELFGVLYLDAANQVVDSEIVSIGSLNANIVHPREVFKRAILESAASVILAHNHPSGNIMPSSDDIELTKRLLQAGEIIGIKVLDHIIVSDKNFVSMKERGLL